MLDRYFPFRTSMSKGKDFDKIIRKAGVPQSWLLRYLFDQALANLDWKHLKQAIKNDPLSQPKPKKGVAKKDDDPIESED